MWIMKSCQPSRLYSNFIVTIARHCARFRGTGYVCGILHPGFRYYNSVKKDNFIFKTTTSPKKNCIWSNKYRGKNKLWECTESQSEVLGSGSFSSCGQVILSPWFPSFKWGGWVANFQVLCWPRFCFLLFLSSKWCWMPGQLRDQGGDKAHICLVLINNQL